MSDGFNAELLKPLIIPYVRFNSDKKRFLHFDGKKWVYDDRESRWIINELKCFIMTCLYPQVPFAEEYRQKIMDAFTDDINLALRLTIFIRLLFDNSNLTFNKLKNLANMFSTDPDLLVKNSEMNPDKHLINVNNGVVDLRTGKFYLHHPDFLIDKITECNYFSHNNKELPPKFKQLFSTLFGCKNKEFSQDEINSRFDTCLQYLGVCLTGETSLRKFAIIKGESRIGKTTLLSAFDRMLGSYSMTIQIESLLKTNKAQHRNDLARLSNGVRFALCSESHEDDIIDSGTVKRLSGGEDKIVSRELYQEFFEYSPTFKIAVATNFYLRLTQVDKAIASRILFMESINTLNQDQYDPNFPLLLQEEYDDFFSYLVQYSILFYQQQKIDIALSFIQAKEKYLRCQGESFELFWERQIIISAGEISEARILYRAYVKFSSLMGLKNLTEKDFSKALAERGFSVESGLKYRTSKGRFYSGIGVKNLEKLIDPWMNLDFMFPYRHNVG